MNFNRRALLKSAVASIACLIPGVAKPSMLAVVPYEAMFIDFRNLSYKQFHDLASLFPEYPNDCLYGWQIECENGNNFMWLQANSDLRPLFYRMQKIALNSPSSNCPCFGLSHFIADQSINISEPLNDLCNRTPFVTKKINGEQTWVRNAVEDAMRQFRSKNYTRA